MAMTTNWFFVSASNVSEITLCKEMHQGNFPTMILQSLYIFWKIQNRASTSDVQRKNDYVTYRNTIQN